MHGYRNENSSCLGIAFTCEKRNPAWRIAAFPRSLLSHKADRGVRVRLLLDAGTTLYELEPTVAATDGPKRRILPFGISGGSLHTKTFAVDGERLFVGSFNFDPRSVRLNCEMGFLIDSPTLARRIEEAFDGPLIEPFTTHRARALMRASFVVPSAPSAHDRRDARCLPGVRTFASEYMTQ